MAEREHNKGLVCVTGGTGFVASWLIMRLLERGYSVHTTIRPDPPEGKRNTSFLTSLPNASEKLKIFHANLNDPNSFDEPIKGCIGVFHVATPLDFQNKEPEDVLVNRAINGTLDILKACLKSKTVKRVVYTSSSSTVFINRKTVDFMDESSWSDLDYIRSFKTNFDSYMVSKTLTEKRALEFAAEQGLDLVTVLPSYILGPFICPKFPGSVYIALAMLLGKEELYFHLINVSMVHIDDVARAHIFLFENPEAKGRYNCSTLTIKIEEMSKFLSAKYPDFPIPTIESLKDIKGYDIPGLSSKKLLDSGFKFKYGLDEMFDDAVQCCKEKGYL